MFATSKISIVNKLEPTLRYQTFDVTKQKWRTVEETNYSLRQNEELRIISSSPYTYKNGQFYIVISKSNRVFTIDENDVNLHGTYNYKPTPYNANHTPLFTQELDLFS